MVKEIELTKGAIALVDDDSYEWLSQWKWHFGGGYARRAIRVNGRQRIIYMHRQITGAPTGLEVDHINQDPLDNRRDNLRVCTGKENRRNQKLHRRSTSGYYGVCHAHGGYMAQIAADSQKYYLGLYNTPEEAARAYDAAAIELHGEFASLNFPSED